MPVESVFGERKPDISDEGFMSATDFGNLAELSVVTGDIDKGSIGETYDFDVTTYCGTDGAGNEDKHITFDLLKIYENIILTAYFSAFSVGAVTSNIVKIETSKDGSSWTSRGQISQAGATAEEFENVSANVDVRYVRLKVDIVYGGGQLNGGRLYDIKIRRVAG